MAQGRKAMSVEGRIDLVEQEQDHLRDSLNRLVDSQEKQTSELRENTAAVMVMCHKLDSSTELGKKALDKADKALNIGVILQTQRGEDIRNEKTHFIGLTVSTLVSIAAILKAFGVI